MLQKVTIIGNLGGDPELKYTQSGDAVCAFSVAASEKWTGAHNALGDCLSTLAIIREMAAAE